MVCCGFSVVLAIVHLYTHERSRGAPQNLSKDKTLVNPGPVWLSFPYVDSTFIPHEIKSEARKRNNFTLRSHDMFYLVHSLSVVLAIVYLYIHERSRGDPQNRSKDKTLVNLTRIYCRKEHCSVRAHRTRTILAYLPVCRLNPIPHGIRSEARKKNNFTLRSHDMNLVHLFYSAVQERVSELEANAPDRVRMMALG